MSLRYRLRDSEPFLPALSSTHGIWLILLTALFLMGQARAEFPEIEVRNAGGTDLGSSSNTAFGSVPVGSSVTRSFTLKNIGYAALGIQSATFGGQNRSDYTATLTGPASLDIGVSRTFSVTFAPSKAGPLVASLTIINNDFNEGSFVMNFTGVGTAPEIEVSAGLTGALTDGASTVNFGSVQTGSVATRRLTVRNPGSAPLAGLSVVAGGSSAFAAGTLPALSLPAGGSMVFTVSFTPSGTGTAAGFLRITSNDADENPFDIALSGTGMVPMLAIEQPAETVLADESETVSFGDTLIGRAATLAFTVRNIGAAPLTGIALTVDGPFAGEFVAGPIPSTTLNPGEFMSVELSFTPGAPGVRDAALHLLSVESQANPIDISLTGFGTTGGDQDDPDGDGTANLLEYATGGDPLVPGLPPGELAGSSGALTFSFNRRSAAAGEVKLDVEWSESLTGPWTGVDTASLFLESDDGVMQGLHAALPAVAGGRQFVRLRATRL